MVRNHTRFTLPGLRDDALGTRKMLLALAWAFCYHWNSRRLENHFYVFWTMVLIALTADQATLLVAPQYKLWSVERPAPGNPTSSASATGNAASANITVAENNAEEADPDFSIIRLGYSWLNAIPASLARFWNTVSPGAFTSLKIDFAGIPVIIECKRSISRSKDARHFARLLGSVFGEARDQLERAAIRLFRDERRHDQEQVILIATCGDWWIWRIATRKAMEARAAALDVDIDGRAPRTRRNEQTVLQTQLLDGADPLAFETNVGFDEETLGYGVAEEVRFKPAFLSLAPLLDAVVQPV